MILLILVAPLVLGALIAIGSSPRRTSWVIGLSVATNAADVLRQRFGVEEYTVPLAIGALGFGLLQLLSSLPRLKRRPAVLPLAMMVTILAAVVSALMGPFVAINPPASIEAVTRLFPTLLLGAAVMVSARREPGLRALLSGLATGAALLSWITVFQVLTGTKGNDFLGFARWAAENVGGLGDTLRAAGAYRVDPNQYAQVLVVGIGCAVGLGWFRRSNYGPAVTLMRRLSILTMVFAVSQTASRGGLLALAALLGFGILRYRPSRNQWLAIFAAAMILILGPFGVSTRLASLGDAVSVFSPTGKVESSLTGRASEMLAAIEMFEDHPLYGVGYGSYNDRYLEYSRTIGLDPRFEERSAHSLPLEVAAEEGIVGLAIWTVFMVLAAAAVWRARDTDVGLSVMLAFVGYSVAGVFLHNANGRLRWTMVAMAFHVAVVAANRYRLQRPLRIGIITDDGLAVTNGHRRAEFATSRHSDDITLGTVGTAVVWPDTRQLRRAGLDRSNLPALHQVRARLSTRIAMYRFDPHVVHAVGGLSTLRNAVAHSRETGSLVVADVGPRQVDRLLRQSVRGIYDWFLLKANVIVLGQPVPEVDLAYLQLTDRYLHDPRYTGPRTFPDHIVLEPPVYEALMAARGTDHNVAAVAAAAGMAEAVFDDRGPLVTIGSDEVDEEPTSESGTESESDAVAVGPEDSSVS